MRSSGFVVLALIAIVGAVNLPMPFGGDQAMFISYARSMDAGSLLYRDLWDSKPPGIYLFYLLAGRLFGFNQIGGHALELLYLLAFSLVLMWTSRSWLDERVARLALPLFAVGIYYLIAETKQMAQVEVLAGFPIYLALWFGVKGENARSIRRCAFASGLAGGSVVWLKIYFLPILAVIWGATLLGARREPGGWPRACVRRIVATGAGFSVPVLAMLAWVLAHGVAREFWWTAFVYPHSAVAMLHHNEYRMQRVMTWLAASDALALLLGAWAVWTVFRGRRTRGMFGGAVIWLLVGLLLIVGEKSWWKYYSLILVVPIGMLAALGLDDVWRRTGRRGKLLLAAGSLLLLLSPFHYFASKFNMLRRHDFGVTLASRTDFRKEMHQPFDDSLDEAEFIRSEIGPDETFHVFGDPLILMLSGRSDAIPINGWAPQTWSPEMWNRIFDQLREARPDYVYISAYVGALMRPRAPALWQFLKDNYSVVTSDKYHAWVELRERAEDGAGPAG